ncbi:PREDICTED: receptor like protein 30-like [Ipomoea nil]|uniref:receptor like protein 30-like n=1 Tax=Ipomoea nil TaxID=35883 RepID=UPI0009012174|nr:PREDICTED: receptor like protein 30-like [Ipomoea nil]
MGKKLLWVVIFVVLVNSMESLGCLEEERIALLQLKANIKVTGKTLASWVDDKKSNCCEWIGVACSNITRRVVELNINYVRDYRIGYWYINASVFLPLQQLNVLQLEGNYLAGSVENGGFDKLAELQNLKVLHLVMNNLNRSILSSLSHLSSLKQLHLTGNPLHSTFDNSGHERLSGLSNLELLTMGSTMMEDKNVLSALNLKDFTSLKELSIGSNNFQIFGQIKGGGGLKKLEKLLLFNNRFNNDIFQSLKGLPSLKILDLSGNDFHGPLHIDDINALNNLEDLNLGFNFIEGFETIANFSSGGLVLCNYSLSFFMTYLFSLIF